MNNNNNNSSPRNQLWQAITASFSGAQNKPPQQANSNTRPTQNWQGGQNRQSNAGYQNTNNQYSQDNRNLAQQNNQNNRNIPQRNIQGNAKNIPQNVQATIPNSQQQHPNWHGINESANQIQQAHEERHQEDCSITSIADIDEHLENTSYSVIDLDGLSSLLKSEKAIEYIVAHEILSKPKSMR